MWYFARSTGLLSCLAIFLFASSAQGEPPAVSYIFPAGGQRGTTVDFRVGGHYLHEECPFEMTGRGIEFPERIHRTQTLWFEGPVIPIPASQRREDYPKDYAGRLSIDDDAPLGSRTWRVRTSQGIAPGMKFLVGELPEVVEQEIDGDPIPVPVTLPVTINGRIFPREDVDIWTFEAQAGEIVTCEVHAARIGSGLDARLEIRDESGKRIAENIDGIGTDSFVRFTVPATGTYAVHIHDVNFGGLQHFVYRLTITAGPYLDRVFPLGGRRGTTTAFELSGANMPAEPVEIDLPDEGDSLLYRHPGSHSIEAIVLDLDDLPETVEHQPNHTAETAQVVSIPAVLNGRIEHPGDVDYWAFDAEAEDRLQFDLRAARLGSPLDSVLTLFDSDGNQIAFSDDIGNGQTDSRFDVTIPKDGRYVVRVEERIASRGGPEFAYRLRVSRNPQPDFQLFLTEDAVSLEPGKQARLKLDIERSGGFNEEIELEFENLPEAVSLQNNKVGKGQANVQLVLKAEETVPFQTAQLVLRGRAQHEEQPISRQAQVRGAIGEPMVAEIDSMVTVPTPFQFFGTFETQYAARGSVYVRRYQLDRGGFEGPIEISLADRQARHLQGVSGPKIIIPPGATEFEYPVTLAPWMEVGRTSRTCLMAVGVVEGQDGTQHQVTFTSEQQNDQTILLVDPGRLSVEVQPKSLRAQPGGHVPLSLNVSRATDLAGAVTVEMIVPEHIGGIGAEPITISADQSSSELSIGFAAEELGPFNQPLTIRATMTDDRGFPVVAETEVTIVPPID